jgi:hypothetical protein
MRIQELIAFATTRPLNYVAVVTAVSTGHPSSQPSLVNSRSRENRESERDSFPRLARVLLRRVVPFALREISNFDCARVSFFIGRRRCVRE